MCAANGSWSPDPADVTCHEIGIHASSKISQVVLNKPLAIIALTWLPQIISGFASGSLTVSVGPVSTADLVILLYCMGSGYTCIHAGRYIAR